MLENQKEKFYKKEAPIFNLSVQISRRKKRHRKTTYETEISAFNVLLPEFLGYQVNNIKKSFIIFKYNFNNSQNLFELNQIASMNIVQDAEKWTVVDVPGDGNCWIYATLI